MYNDYHLVLRPLSLLDTSLIMHSSHYAVIHVRNENFYLSQEIE